MRSIDPNTSSGAAVFVQDTAIYDSQGLLHADIDTLTGGFNSGHLDPIGYKGELGNYTDLETQRSVSGLYTALSGPGGTLYYDPMSGVVMARSEAASANEYANNLAPVEHALHEGFVGVAGIVGYSAGPVGSALAAGAIDAEITYLEGNDAKTSLLSGAKTAAVTLAFGKAGEIIGGPLVRYVAGRLSRAAAPEVAGAVSDLARKGNCFVAGTPVQMADGTTKPIEQVRTGDLVKSRNPKTGKIEARRVDRTYVRVAPQVLTLTFTDAHTSQIETFTCTPEHPFYVDGQGYVEAQSLGIGTSIVTRAGPCLTLSTVAWNAPVGQASGNGLLLDGQAHPAGITVYNLRVEDTHNYFVGTQDGGTCVHNANYPLINLEHIFHGEINASGKAVGFHHEGSIGSIGKARITAITGAENSQGVYRGTVEVFDKASGTWVVKASQSTFFPKSWSRAKVLSEIRGAYANRGPMNGNAWQGVSPSGVRIKGYLNSSGGINTAFPVY